MRYARECLLSACGVTVLALATAGRSSAMDDLYAPPNADQVRARTLEWVAAHKVDEQSREQIAKLWVLQGETPPARVLLDKTIESFALADAETKTFVAACRLADAPLVPPEPKLLERDGMDEFYTANLRVFYGRYLAQRKMYDEALGVLSDVDPNQVIDPATCLFYRAVCEHQLLKKDEGLATIEKLLRNTENVPPSYSTVAALMQYELEALRDKTLDAISRKMRDSERRLELARGGKRVQTVQKEIIADLDEMIEKLEKQGGS